MDYLGRFQRKVLDGGELTGEEALLLGKEDPDRLADAANRIRKHFCGDSFDLCTIVSGKCGGCSEDCIYCAQSSRYQTGTPVFGVEDIAGHLPAISRSYLSGAVRCGCVTAGKTLTDSELETLLNNYRKVRSVCGVSLCASHGLLTFSQIQRLKEAGVTRYHANLETSRRYFPHVCTTHTYDDKIAVIKAAQSSGLEVCSGGIFGIGETMEDRIAMALELRGLGVRSVPINILHPIPGTPLEDAGVLSFAEVKRIVAIYRFLLPDAVIRLAGGRGLMPARGRELFLSGANAAISGDMLTTAGVSLRDDRDMIRELGFSCDQKSRVFTT